jgi:signal peptidase
MTLAVAVLKRLWKNEYFKTAVMIIIVVAIVFGFWFGSQMVLSTQYPALAVASGSMCMLPGSYCDGWSNPFEPTLHVGDLIIVRGVNPEEIKAAPYPNGDIIVFHQPYADGELIVHRAIANQTVDGKFFFKTKGDGNASPDSTLVSEDHVVGKVILRIPWVGHISLLMNNSFGILIIALLLIILVIAEFIVPALSRGKAEVEQKEDVEETFGEPKAL